MANLFISLPMNGRKDEDVIKRRQEIFEMFKKDGDALIDTMIPELAPAISKEPRLFYLGRAIQLMKDADLVIFAHDWKTANGCVAEHTICELYNIPYINMSEDWDV